MVLAEIAAPAPSAVVRLACLACLGMVLVSGVGAMLRVVRGPTLADRVVGLDLLGTLVVAGVLVYGVLSAQVVLIWVSLVLALLLFLGTVAFSYALLHGTAK
jgi:multicomponent Na+:H+ antiporter subunit F